MGHDDKIVLARVRIATMEMLIEDIQVRQRSDMESLLDMINELKNHKIYVCHGCFLEPMCPGIMDMMNNTDIKHMIPPIPPRDTEPPVGSPISLSPSLAVGSSSPVRSYRDH
ncbi:hypothetical protein Tco_0171683 [Tanacetum coccineum]